MNDHVPAMRRRVLSAFILLLALPRLPQAGAQTTLAKPEKARLEVATAGSGTTSLPLLVALDSGYFAKRGLNVSVDVVGANVAVQGVISGAIDIYQGGTAAIAANLQGADIIYVTAPVDRNSLILFGQKDVTSFESLRGKTIATTFPGAFGEIAVRMTARKRRMELSKDIKLLFHRSPPEALQTFLTGNAGALVISPPQSELAKHKGYPVIIDYFKEGLKIIGPGTAVTREFAQKASEHDEAVFDVLPRRIEEGSRRRRLRQENRDEIYKNFRLKNFSGKLPAGTASLERGYVGGPNGDSYRA